MKWRVIRVHRLWLWMEGEEDKEDHETIVDSEEKECDGLEEAQSGKDITPKSLWPRDRIKPPQRFLD